MTITQQLERDVKSIKATLETLKEQVQICMEFVENAKEILNTEEEPPASE